MAFFYNYHDFTTTKKQYRIAYATLIGFFFSTLLIGIFFFTSKQITIDWSEKDTLIQVFLAYSVNQSYSTLLQPPISSLWPENIVNLCIFFILASHWYY